MRVDEADHSGVHGGKLWSRGSDIQALLREYVPADVNDPWYPPSDSVQRAIGDIVPFVNNTPSCWVGGLRGEIATALDVSPDSLLVAAGASPLIERLVVASLPEGGEVVVVEPGYSEYARVARARGARIRTVHLQLANDFRIDYAEIVGAVGPSTRLVILANPNNPTGRSLTADEIRAIIEAVPQDVHVVIDEVYIDYCREHSVYRMVRDYPNLAVIRSFSKAHALGGLRVGFAVCGEGVMAALLAWPGLPWSVSLFAQAAAARAVHDDDYVMMMIGRTRQLRDELVSGVESVERLRVLPSVTNFFLVDTHASTLDANAIVRGLAEERVLVRDCSSFGKNLGSRFFRMAVRSASENEKILCALAKVVDSR